MRLTADLISTSISFLNPLKERELDLRGHKIPAIENLAVAGPQDAIDLTDNDLTSLANFPLSPRLRTLLLARNRLTHIHPSITTSIPNLTVLILTQNSLAELADLDPLGACGGLTHLSVLENPVTRKENYRSYTIFRIPSVRFLDFQKVRDVERERAKRLFGTVEAPTGLAKKIMGVKSKGSAGAGAGVGAGTFDTADEDMGASTKGAAKSYRVKLTDKEKKRVEKLIRGASSLAEISRLEKELNEGRIPGGVGGGKDDEMDED